MPCMVSSPQVRRYLYTDFKREGLIKIQVKGGGICFKGELNNFIGIKILILHYLQTF